MNANTLASAVAAARNASLPPSLCAQSPLQAAPQTIAPVVRPAPAAPALSDADALMIAIQRSARTVDDIMTRRMLLASAGSASIGRK